MAKVKKNKRSVIVLFFATLLCVSFAISVFSMMRDIKEIDDQIADTKIALANQIAENDDLRKKIYSDNKDDYVDGIAREEGFVKPGERVYYDISVND